MPVPNLHNISSVTLDEHEISVRYLILDNAAIHKVAAVQELIERREYKDVYLPPYSSFLDPIELFWSKVKAGVKRDCLTGINSLSARFTESSEWVTVDDCYNWIKHSASFFDRCLALSPYFSKLCYIFFSLGGFLFKCHKAYTIVSVK